MKPGKIAEIRETTKEWSSEEGEWIRGLLEDRDRLLRLAKALWAKTGDGYDTQNHLYPELEELGKAAEEMEL